MGEIYIMGEVGSASPLGRTSADDDKCTAAFDAPIAPASPVTVSPVISRKLPLAAAATTNSSSNGTTTTSSCIDIHSMTVLEPQPPTTEAAVISMTMLPENGVSSIVDGNVSTSFDESAKATTPTSSNVSLATAVLQSPTAEATTTTSSNVPLAPAHIQSPTAATMTMRSDTVLTTADPQSPTTATAATDVTTTLPEKGDDSADDEEEKAATTEVQRKRKRCKRVGYSGNRYKQQKRQSAGSALQLQVPESSADVDNGRVETPESPIFGESAGLYATSATAGEGGVWDWSLCDVYYEAIQQQNLEQLVRIRKSCANVVAANVDAAAMSGQHEAAQVAAMLRDANDSTSARVRPLRRGRRYRDVWEEADYLAAQRKRDAVTFGKHRVPFSDQSVLQSHHDLVHGYDDARFQHYIQQLEAQSAAEAEQREADDERDGDGNDTSESLRKPNKTLTCLSATVLPPLHVYECHPAAWGTWMIKKPTISFDVVHPASLGRKKAPSHWREEATALAQLEREREATASNDNSDSDAADATVSNDATHAQRSTLPVEVALWGNGKDDVVQLPTFGTVLEDDGVSRSIAASLAALLPLSMHNWRLAQTVYERAAVAAECAPTLQHEAELMKRVEALYQRLYPRRDSADDDVDSSSTGASARVPVFHSRRADVVVHSVKFCRDIDESHCVAASVEYALTLQVGDEVDVLDRNGCWNDGIVVDVFSEGEQLVKYVLLQFLLWDSSATEWVSVTEGRILPRGVAAGKTSFVVAALHTRKRRIEFNQALADTLEKTLPMRHVEQNAAAAARKKRAAVEEHKQHKQQLKEQKKKAKRVTAKND